MVKGKGIKSLISSLFGARIPPSPILTPSSKIIHGSKRVDPFFSFQNCNKTTIEYLKAENKYGDFFIKKKLYSIEEKVKKSAEKFYFTSIKGEKTIYDDIDGFRYFQENGIHYRISPSIDKFSCNREYIWNEKHSNDSGYQFSSIQVSPNHELIAILEKRVGEEHGRVRIKNIHDDKFLSDVIENVINFLWIPKGNDSIIYTSVHPVQLRPYKIGIWNINKKGAQVDLYTEEDDSFLVDVSLTKDKKYLLLSSSSRTTSEIRLLDVSLSLDPSNLFCMDKRSPNHEYFLDHHNGKFYILTNWFSKTGDFQLAIVDSHKRNKKYWKPIDFNYGSKGDIIIADMDIFSDSLIVYATINMRPFLIDFNPITKESLFFPLPRFYTLTPGINRGFFSTKCRFILTGIWTLEALYEYCLISKTFKIIRNVEIGKKQNPEIMSLKQNVGIVRIKAGSDNIPVSIVFDKTKSNLSGIENNIFEDNIKRNALNINEIYDFNFDSKKSQEKFPCLIIAYGCYGINMETLFEPSLFTLIENGWILCFAHLKGGGEFGKNWYNEGRHLNKPQTIDSLIEIANYFNNRWCKGMVSGYGTSAGGLIMGSALIKGIKKKDGNFQSLFRACILNVPFLDPLSAMLDKSFPLTSTEIDEWGDPILVDNDFKCIQGYSPYENIPIIIGNDEAKLPDIWISSGELDKRVPYWHGLKFCARLRSSIKNYKVKSEYNLICITNPDTGHFQTTSESTWISFLLHCISNHARY